MHTAVKTLIAITKSNAAKQYKSVKDQSAGILADSKRLTVSDGVLEAVTTVAVDIVGVYVSRADYSTI